MSPGRHKSRSRSRRRRNKARSSSEEGSGSEKKGSRSPPPPKAPPPTRRKEPVAEEEDAAGDCLEARVALLEVENETLKAENRELRKKLVEAIRAGRSSAQPASASSAAGTADTGARDRRRGEPEASAGKKDKKDTKPEKARAEKSDNVKRIEKGRESEKGHNREARREPEPQEDEPGMNAVQLANAQMETYNEAIANNIPPESRLPLVEQKLARFLDNFSEKAQIIDLKSDKPVFKDRKNMGIRYSCVFRESGAKLKGSCKKRFYFDATRPRGPSYVLDFETHESLVTNQPGTPPDGKLGVRPPRTEHLCVLYEEHGGKITRMWLRQDSEKIGLDPYAGEDIICRSEAYKAFEERLGALFGNGKPPAPTIFHNYHDIPSVG